MVKRLLSLLLLAIPCYAGEVAVTTFKGLNTQDTSATLLDGESPFLLNVDVTPGGTSVKSRQGYGTYKTLTTSTSPVHGGHHFQDSNGNDIQIWGADSYQSIFNGLAPVQISTMAAGATIQCADSQGFAYCLNTNREIAIRTAGTVATTSFQQGIPLGTMLTFTPTRLAVSGVSGTPNTIYVSSANVFTTFTTGVTEFDPFTEVIASPGSRITHIRYACGKILWWKDQSFGYLIGDDQFSIENIIVTPDIGTLDNSSDEYNGVVYFRGQDNHIYQYDCSNVTRLSRAITPTIGASSRRKANSWTQTSQSDFSTGSNIGFNGPTIALSTTIVSGSIYPSSITITDTNSFDFGQGTFDSGVDSTTVSGAITLHTYIGDTFSNMSRWTERCGTVSTSGSDADFTSSSHAFEQTASSSPSGHFIVQFDFRDTNVTPPNDERLSVMISTSSGLGLSNDGYVVTILADSASTAYRVYLSSTSSINGKWNDGSVTCNSPGKDIGAPSVFISSFSVAYDTSNHTLKWTRNNTTGSMSLYFDGTLKTTASNTAYSTFLKAYVAAAQATGLGHWHMDNFYFTSRQGTMTSRVFDTAFSTPVYGTFESGTSGTSDVSTWAYDYQCSATSGSGYTSPTAISTGSVITGCSHKRYLIYAATMTATNPASLPQITDVSVVAASTGTFYSAVNNAPSLTSWDIFSVGDSTSGTVGNITYYVRSSTNHFVATSSTVTWIAQTKNTTVAASTGTYFQMRADFNIAVASEVPSLSNFTFNWFEGNASDKAYIQYFNDNVWVSVSSGSSGTNNQIQRWDLLNQTWLLDNIASNGFVVDQGRLYFGSPASGKVFLFGQSVYTDNGSDIYSVYKTKDFVGSDPWVNNEYISSDFIFKQSSNTVTATYTVDTSTPTNRDLNLYDPVRSIVRRSINLPPGKVGTLYSLMISDTGSEQWELMGSRTRYNALPWKVQ